MVLQVCCGYPHRKEPSPWLQAGHVRRRGTWCRRCLCSRPSPSWSFWRSWLLSRSVCLAGRLPTRPFYRCTRLTKRQVRVCERQLSRGLRREQFEGAFRVVAWHLSYGWMKDMQHELGDLTGFLRAAHVLSGKRLELKCAVQLYDAQFASLLVGGII